MRRTEKYAAVTRDEGNAVDGRFPTASKEKSRSPKRAAFVQVYIDFLLLFMAIIAFLEGGLFARIFFADLFMAVLAVLVIGKVQFEHVTLLFQRTVALGTFLYGIPLF